MKKQVTGVLHKSRSHRADILFNPGRALRLGRFINGQELTRGRWKLIGSDSTVAENIFRNRHCRRGIRPARVESEMRDDLRKFAWLDTIIERRVEMVWHLDRLITCDQGCHGNDAAVSWR
jgi:hypothetical protein